MSGSSSIGVDVHIEVVSVDGSDDVLDEVIRRVEASGLVAAVATTIHGRWIEIASSALGRTAEAYVGAISDPVSDSGEITLGLGDSPPPWPAELANWLENGLDPYDMKVTHLRSGASLGRGGRYKVLRFEHAEPGRGSGTAPAMGYPYRASRGDKRAEQIGRRVARAAQSLMPDERLGSKFAPKLKKTHKTDIYAGMERRPGAGAGGGSGYFTFRTISERSQGWEHPGIQARDFITQTATDMETMLPDVIRGVIEGALGDLGGLG